MASSFPRFGNAGPPLGGNSRASWRASRARASSSASSRAPGDAARRPVRAPRRALSRTALAAGGATATALLAVDRARAERAPVADGLDDLDDLDVVEDAAVRSKVVAFYDLDHTVIDTNSNKHWIAKEVKAGRVTPKLIFTAIYWFARYAMGRGEGAEAAGAEAAMAYAGVSARALRMEVEAVFDAALAHRMRPGCGPTMARHRENGERVIICTSSWQYAARYAAALFGLETDDENIISSVMEEDARGVLTGRVATVAYGDGKYRVTKKWADANGVDLKDCYFYSDSMSDVLLLEKVGHPVVVNPDPRLRKHAEARGWPIEDWGKAEEALPEKKPGLRWR